MSGAETMLGGLAKGERFRWHGTLYEVTGRDFRYGKSPYREVLLLEDGGEQSAGDRDVLCDRTTVVPEDAS